MIKLSDSASKLAGKPAQASKQPKKIKKTESEQEEEEEAEEKKLKTHSIRE